MTVAQEYNPAIAVDKESPEPIYAQIAKAVYHDLARRGGDFRPVMPSERDFAERLGVSRNTIRRTYSLLVEYGVAEPAGRAGRLRVSPGIREKRLEILPKSLGIILLNDLGRTIDTSSRGTLDYVAGIVDACTEKGYSVTFVTFPPPGAPDGEAETWSAQLEASVCGVVHFGLKRVGDAVHPLHARVFEDASFAQIALSAESDLPHVASVHADHRPGYLAAAEHLLGLGHRRFGVLRSAVRRNRLYTPHVCRRMDDLLAVLRECGAGVRPESVALCDLNEDSVAAGVDRVFGVEAPPTALFCQNDQMALWAVDGLRRRGLSVARDVSVIGYDDIPQAAACDVPLTTVAHPCRTLGRKSAQLLFDRRERGALFDRTVVTVPTSLIVRESCAPCAEGAASRNGF